MISGRSTRIGILESDWEILLTSYDQVEVAIAVLVILLCLLSLVSSVIRGLNRGRLHFHWWDLNALGLLLLFIARILRITKGSWGGIAIPLFIIGVLCLIVAVVIGLFVNQSKQQA
jgi:hypothetical protein